MTHTHAGRVVALWAAVLLLLWLLGRGDAPAFTPLIWFAITVPALALTWWWLRRMEEGAPLPPAKLPTFTDSPETKIEPVLFLGDVFTDVNERNELVWEGAPVPGARIRMLLVADGELDTRASSAWLAPFRDGPYAAGRSLATGFGAFRDDLATRHRFIEIELPADASPGFHWLRVAINDIDPDPIRIEIADPVWLEARAQAFAAADRLLAAADETAPCLLTGPYSPLPVAEVRGALADDDAPWVESDRCWVFFASRLDAHGAVQLEEGRDHDLLVVVDAATSAGSVHRRFGLASWTLYNFPQRPPRGGYNGWWWKRFDLPAGGTCGTAWCNYPFAGNGVATVSDRVAIPAPPPPDPLDWWQGRGGWICGNGWFQGRRGPGGIRYGPWWPIDGDGVPRPGLGGPAAGPDDPPPDEDRDETPGTVPRRPPGLQPPPGPATCAADFVEAVSKYTYGRPPYGRRLQGSRVGAPPARYDMLPAYEAELRWARLPDGWTRANGYTYAWTEEQVTAELARNRRWWARYCIAVTDREVVLADDRRLRGLAQDYRKWLDDLPRPARPDVVMGLGDALTKRGIDLLARAGRLYAETLRGDASANRATHVLFMPRVVGRTGHTGENRSRPTEASFTDPAGGVVVLNVRDADDDFILVHELIHTWGRPSSRITWDHKSGDPRAMSRIIRQTIAQPAGLTEDRLLDYAEYDEILTAGIVRPRSP